LTGTSKIRKNDVLVVHFEVDRDINHPVVWVDGDINDPVVWVDGDINDPVVWVDRDINDPAIIFIALI